MDSKNNRYLEFTDQGNTINNTPWYFTSLCADWTGVDNDGNTMTGTGTDTSDNQQFS